MERAKQYSMYDRQMKYFDLDVETLLMMEIVSSL